MLFNCLGWVTYSILIQNLFVFFGNIFALCLSVWLNMIALELQYSEFRTTEIRRSIVQALQEHKVPEVHHLEDHARPLDYAKLVWDVAALNTRAPVAHKTIILVLTVAWTAILSVVCWGRSFPANVNEFVVGIAVNLNLVFFYGAPLSTIFTVLSERSSATIHIPTTITMFLNGSFWAIFGFAVLDWFIAIPNLLGALLGAVQIFLCLAFPRTNSRGVTDVKVSGIDKEDGLEGEDDDDDDDDVERVKDKEQPFGDADAGGKNEDHYPAEATDADRA